MTGLDPKTILEWIRAAKAKGVGLEVETKREPIGAIIVRSVNGEVGESTLHTYGDAIAEFLEEQEKRCTRCQSPAPHLHPAMQSEGEVQPCNDPFHLRVTPENTPDKIARAQQYSGECISSLMSTVEQMEKKAS